MPDPNIPQDSPHKKGRPPAAPAPKPKKKEEDKKNEEEEDSGYKMLDIAWEAFAAAKAIHINLANMAWDNVLKDPYNAAKAAVKDKVSELTSSVSDAAGKLGHAALHSAEEALGSASKAGRDLLEFTKGTPRYSSPDDDEVEMTDFASKDNDSDDDSADETELDDFSSDDSDDDSDDEESDADWGNEAESGGLPMTPPQTKSPPPPMASLQTTTSNNPGESTLNTASKQEMPKGTDSSAKGAGKDDLSEEVVKGAEMGM
ncbi:MAG: hypothetical protein H0T84_02370 [Tatlockia sp.]|nr:hypothetical protein [Tatlockia sp.]